MKEIIYGKPRLVFDPVNQVNALVYPQSKCEHYWTYPYVDHQYKLCLNCGCRAVIK